jgi:hypothetical protein
MNKSSDDSGEIAEHQWGLIKPYYVLPKNWDAIKAKGLNTDKKYNRKGRRK